MADYIYISLGPTVRFVGPGVIVSGITTHWTHLDRDRCRPVHLPFIRVHHEGDMNACTKLYANVVDLVNAELELPTYVFGK